MTDLTQRALEGATWTLDALAWALGAAAALAAVGFTALIVAACVQALAKPIRHRLHVAKVTRNLRRQVG